MKIIQMDLEDFGIYHNITWNPPENGLIVMHGQNESGKTTLMKYVRSMFFGYLRGDWQGLYGHMDIRRMNGREYRIYRNEKESYISTGDDTMHEEPSNLWWHGLDRQTYDKIFAMGLEDLQGFKILSNDEVRSHFFSVEGGVRMGVTRRDLIRLMGDIFVASPQGKKPVNVLLNEQKEYDQHIYSLAYEETEFADLQAKEQETHEEENRIRISITETKHQIEKISMPIAAWEVYKQGQDALVHMQSLAEVSQFPENGAQRWKELETKISEIDGQIKQLEDTSQKNSAYKEEWNRWIACGDQLENLFRQIPQWKQGEEEITNSQQKEATWKSEIKQLKMSMDGWTGGNDIFRGIDWETGKALATDVALYRQEQEKWEAAKPKNVGVDLPADDKSSSERTKEEWQEIGSTVNHIQQDLIEQDKLKEQLTWLQEEPVETSRAFLWFGILLVLAAAALAAGVILYGLDQTAGYIGSGICGVLAAGAFWKQNMRTNRAPEKIGELRGRLEYLHGHISALAEKAGITVPEDSDNIIWDTRLDKVRKQYMDWKTRETKGEWEKQQQVIYDSMVKKWQDEGKICRSNLADSEQRWSKWQQISGLINLEASQVPVAKDCWEKWLTITKEYQDWMGQQENWKKIISQLVDDAEQIFREIHVSEPVTPQSIETMYRRWQDIRIQAEVAKEQDKQQRDREDQIARWIKDKEVRVHQQRELMQAAGARSEGDFRSKILKFRQFHQYKEVYEQSEAHIRLIAKNDKNLSDLRRELKVHDMKYWKQQISQCEGSIAEAEKQLAAIAERRGSIVERLSQMAKSDTYSKMLQEKENRKTLLDGKIDVWLTMMYAQYILGEAQTYYEKVRQPLVIRNAGEYLRLMTQGRYTLQATFDGRQLFAIDENQRRIPEKQWSSGLGDQIYLAIRIGLAMAFAQQIEPMPLILDDILVRFDEQRQKEAMRFLADLGKKEQIFLFTCSNETREIAQQVQQELSGETDTVHLFEIEQGIINPV
ncbi:AAA family ATPase [Megasphaera sueciensis]|uniref:AAA family ATPase n=1 Tax=Megasphaera sueciensis TaxID=349094 RepID=UPI003CFE17AC